MTTTTENLITGYAVRTNTDNAYAAPEQLYVRLWGGRAGERELRHTGYIVSLNGTTVQTLSGSVYQLGEPLTGTVEEAAEAIRQGLSRLQSGEAMGYHPSTIAVLLD